MSHAMSEQPSTELHPSKSSTSEAEKVRVFKDTTYFKFTVQNFPSLAGILNLAFSHGGYCAGGYPRMLYHGTKDKTKLRDMIVFASMRQHVRNSCATGSDVDLFFRTKQGHDSFIAALRNSTKLRSFTIKPSFTGMATNIEFRGIDPLPDNDKFYNIQAISAYFGEPEEVIGNFDFSNCMTGFEKHVIWEHEKFRAAEDAQHLEIVNWKQGSLMYRVQKYINNHGYAKMHPETRERFISWMYDTYFKAGTDEAGELKESRHQFRNRVRMILRSDQIITDADLMLLCVMFEGDPNYNYRDAFDELRRRAKSAENPVDVQVALPEYEAL